MTNLIAGIDRLPLAEARAPLERRLFRVTDRLVHELVIGGRRHRSAVFVDDHATQDLQGDWWKAYLKGQRVRPEGTAGPRIRFAELFCGPGGLALGFSQAAAELGLRRQSALAADQDDEAIAIYRRRNETRAVTTSSVSSLVDHRVEGRGQSCEFVYEPELVDEIWQAEVGQIDVVLAGPPCQGHSHLNNRTRFTDRRNQLYLTVPAIAVALRAPVVIIENVRAVIHDKRQVIQSAIALLEGAGYNVETGVVKAADLGWPQRRERFFLVARRDVAPLPLEVVTDAFESSPRDLTWAIGDLRRDPGRFDFMWAQPELSDENRRRIDWLFDHGKHDLPPSERPDCHKGGTTYNAVYGRLHADRPAPTVTTGFMTPGRGRYIHPSERRVLSSQEAARLQGFPDDYDFRPWPPHVPSKAKLGKWIGDAVPMPLGYVAALAALGPGWQEPVR